MLCGRAIIGRFRREAAMTRSYRVGFFAVVIWVAMLAIVTSVAAQEPPAPPTPEQTPAATTPPPADRPGTLPGTPRPYDRVITKDAKSDTGLFTVHRIGERLYYEIPAAQLNKEFLWVTQIAKTTVGAGQGGQAVGSRVVKWERRGNRVLLRSISYDIVADRRQTIAQAVEA